MCEMISRDRRVENVGRLGERTLLLVGKRRLLALARSWRRARGRRAICRQRRDARRDRLRRLPIDDARATRRYDRRGHDRRRLSSRLVAQRRDLLPQRIEVAPLITTEFSETHEREEIQSDRDTGRNRSGARSHVSQKSEYSEALVSSRMEHCPEAFHSIKKNPRKFMTTGHSLPTAGYALLVMQE